MNGEKRSREYYFPEEIWRQIMCFLPGRTLLAFRIISKSFKTIIDDPQFVSSNHFTSRNRHNNPPISLFHTHQIRDCNTGFEPHSKFVVPEAWHDTDLAASLDGLLLFHFNKKGLYYGIRDCKEEGAALWNPCTMRLRYLTLPQLYESNTLLGLYYDSSSQDYKVVCIAYLPLPIKVWLYSIKKRDWILISTSVADCGISTDLYHIDNCSRSFFFNGALHWFHAYMLDEKINYRIVRFELGKLKLSFFYPVTWPLYLKSGSLFTKTKDRVVMLDGGSKLGLFGIDEGVASIWEVAIHGNVFSLNKRHSIPQWGLDHRYPYHVYVSKNGEFTSMGFHVESIQVYTYNLLTQQGRLSRITHPCPTGLFCLVDHSFFQSLIHL